MAFLIIMTPVVAVYILFKRSATARKELQKESHTNYSKPLDMATLDMI
jgi:hypothetical protein